MTRIAQATGMDMDKDQSPLFEPVLWDRSGLRILDETLLPRRIEFIAVSDVSDAVAAVRDMKTRAFGQVLTLFYSAALLAQNYSGGSADPLRRDIGRLIEQFCRARPTFDFRGLGRRFDEWFAEIPAGQSPGPWITDRSCEFARQAVQARRARARRTAAVLPNPARILTHCNVSGELVALARHCKTLEKPFSVVVTETRPYLQGARLTAWELAGAGVPVSLIPDCAIAQVMARGEVNAVLVGSDRVAQNGDIVNKVGTYPLALMAKRYGIPFYALVQNPRSLARGSDVTIEERPADELLVFEGKPLVGDQRVGARYPAFDITPGDLITRLIGFDDVCTPVTFRRRYRLSRDRDPELKPPHGKYLLVFGIMPSSDSAYLSAALRNEGVLGVLVPEMRPQLWGVHRTASALLRRGVTPTLIADSMMGVLFAQREICKLYLYYVSLDEQSVRGICGSLLAVHLAHVHDVPIELRPGALPGKTSDADVSTFMGVSVCPAGASIFPIETEVVPRPL